MNSLKLLNILYPYLHPYQNDMTHILYGFDHGMRKPRVIGVTGNNHNDTDAVARYISRRFMYRRKNFADPIKNIATELHKFAHTQNHNITQNQAVDYLYTNLFQDQIKMLIPHYNKDSLVQHLVSQINDNKRYVIGDLQFYHEYSALVKYNPFIIQLENQNNQTNTSDEYRTIPYDIAIKHDTDYPDLFRKLNIELASCKN